MQPEAGRILVIDDEEMIRSLIVRHLAGRGHSCETTGDGRHGAALAATGAFEVVLCDLKMPGFDGLGVAREIARTAPAVAVVLVTAHATIDTAIRALRYGVADVVLKPFHLDALDEAIGRALTRHRSAHDAEEFRRTLAKRLSGPAARGADEEPTASFDAPLAAAPAPPPPARPAPSTPSTPPTPSAADTAAAARIGAEAALVALVLGVDARRRGVFEIASRAAALAAKLGRRMGLPEDDARAAGTAARLHCVGLASLPDSALAPESQRSPADDDLFRTHPGLGADLIRQLPGFEDVARLVESHRERWDGRGYPRGVAAPAIPQAARAVAAAVAVAEFVSADSGRTRGDLAAWVADVTGTVLGPDDAAVLLGVVAPDPRAPPSTPVFSSSRENREPLAADERDRSHISSRP